MHLDTLDFPRNSSGLPASSVSQPGRNGHQPLRQRTSSNASTSSKRGNIIEDNII